MELGWESRPIPAHNWHPPPPAPSTSASPSAFVPPTASSLLAQRRRSSAAHTRPAAPPPNLPIPNIPEPTEDSSPTSYPSQTQTYTRQGVSPNLAAVAAFSQSRVNATLNDDLSDPPPPSMLHPTREDDNPNHNLTAETRPPSSRRALTRALELAREAVQLDSTNDNPVAAVKAYGRSVALLSEVMERVRRGEDTTEPGGRRRNGRRRSVVAQEEEIRRLQSIHDTYADRMNILSIIYSIPSIPYSTASIYSTMTVSTDSTVSASQSQSSSPSSDSPDGPPTYQPNINAPAAQEDDSDLVDYLEQYTGHDREEDPMDAIGNAMFGSTTPSPIRSTLPPTSAHPYAAQYEPHPSYSQAPLPPSNRTSVQPLRKVSRTSALPPPSLPPPINSLPPAPAMNGELAPEPTTRHHLEVVNTRPRGDSVGHRRTGSGSRLAALEEESERAEDSPRIARISSKPIIPDTMLRTQESPPLPPIPSPTSATMSMDSPNTPRNVPPKPVPPSNIVVPRPRGSSQTMRSEIHIINTTTNQGTIYQRRSKTSNPPTPRSSSPAESTTSVGSVPYPRTMASSLPGGNSVPPVVGRSRSSSQPGRRPSLVGGRISPVDRPPLPNGTVVNGGPPIPQRKPSFPSSSKFGPNGPELTVRTDLTNSPAPSVSSTLVPPQVLSSGLPSTPTSPLPPQPPADPLRQPYHLMHLLRTTMTSPTGGYITRRLHVPQEVWSQGGAKLNNLIEKIRVVGILFSALEDLQSSSSEYFGAGNVSSGLALGIGSIGKKEGEAWIAKLEDFSTVCDGVVANFGKKLGVGEGFVVKKTTWGDKLGRRFDKFTNGKNLDSPAAYVQGLRKLFLHAQLLDEHTKAITSQPVAPAYASFSQDIRLAAEIRLKRSSEFFASVVLTFVVRDLSQLLDKYAKKCEKWLAE